MALFDSIRLGSSAAEDYEIERSLRFNKGDSPNLFRDGGSEGNRKTFTLSVWIKRSSRGEHSFWDFYTNDSNRTIFQLYFGNLRLFSRVGGSTQISCSTNLELRDFSAWYHFVYAVDTTQGTQADRVKMYINGVQQTVSGTLPSQNADTFVGSTNENRIGCQHDSAGNEAFFDGYMAEFNYIDGQQLTPSSFAETDSTTGEYKPIKYLGSYGTRGYYLNFSDNSGTTATTLGKDTSGNGNNLTPNNFSVSAGGGNDSLEDTPTNNFCTLNPLDSNSGINFTNGNLVVNTPGGFDLAKSTFYLTSGKWYWEVTCDDTGNGFIGVSDQEDVLNNRGGGNATSCTIRATNGDKRISGSTSAYGSAIADGDVMMFAVDKDSNKFWAGKNGTWFNSGDPAAGSNEATSALTNPVSPSVSLYDNEDYTFNFGQRAFSYTPPTGYKKICTANLPDPTIKLPDKHFDTLLYTGDGNDNKAISGLSFQPDWIWAKKRGGNNSAEHHWLVDVVRGVTKNLSSSLADSEYTFTNVIKSFTSNGFTLGTDGKVNRASDTYVAWNWKGGGSASSNSDGSLTSSVSANTTAGFSIGTYTGQSSGSATVGHGLGVAPDVVITKSRTSSSNWYIYHKSIGQDGWIILDSNGAATTGNSAVWNPAPTSSVFTYGSGLVNQGDIVFYAFSEVAGYSKFGSYTGNGSSDGTFVFTGFRPRFLLHKDSNSTEQWQIKDTARDTSNPVDVYLHPNLSNAENTSTNASVDFLSNGFKIRTSDGSHNTSGNTYIYLAFAESPFKYARAR